MTEIKGDERQLPLMQLLFNCGGSGKKGGAAHVRLHVQIHARTQVSVIIKFT